MTAMKPTALLGAAALAVLAAAPAHAADKRMVTYDAVSPQARKLTGAGLTFVFTKSFLRTRVLAVHATAVPVAVVVKPSDSATTRGPARFIRSTRPRIRAR